MNFDYIKDLTKNKHNFLFVIILIIGILLILSFDCSSDPPENNLLIDEQTELSEIISSIDGVGKTNVLITYYTTKSDNIVYDSKSRGDDTERNAVISGGNPISTGQTYPRVKGVVVVAENAHIKEIKDAIYEAVTTALDIEDYKVSVHKRN